MVHTIESKAEFDKILNENELVLVDFWASWCGPCNTIFPTVQELEKKHSNVKFVKVDVDKEELSDIVEKYEVEAMPTFALIRSGEVKSKVVGANKSKLTTAVETLAA